MSSSDDVFLGRRLRETTSSADDARISNTPLLSMARDFTLRIASFSVQFLAAVSVRRRTENPARRVRQSASVTARRRVADGNSVLGKRAKLRGPPAVRFRCHGLFLLINDLEGAALRAETRRL